MTEAVEGTAAGEWAAVHPLATAIASTIARTAAAAALPVRPTRL